MSRSIWIWILLLLGWIIFASFICKKYLCNTSLSTAEPVEKILPAEKSDDALSSWIFSDGSEHSIESDEHFRFNGAEFNHLTPLSSSLTGSISSTAEYLKSNPLRSLDITGYYLSSEENKSILPDLGLARANDISKYLVSLGVPAAQLTNESMVLTENWFKGDVLMKGVDFSFGEVSNSDIRLADIKGRLLGKPIRLYFGTNQDKINLSSQRRTDFADIIFYLDNVKESALKVTGHTDGTGNRAHNIKLSKDRADFVSDYLIDKGGINKTRLQMSGVGPDKPLGNNRTESGRAKNRRVEVTLI